MTTTIAGETDLRIADESKVEFFLDAYLYYTVRRVYIHTHILNAGKGGTSLLSFLPLCERVYILRFGVLFHQVLNQHTLIFS